MVLVLARRFKRITNKMNQPSHITSPTLITVEIRHLKHVEILWGDNSAGGTGERSWPVMSRICVFFRHVPFCQAFVSRERWCPITSSRCREGAVTESFTVTPLPLFAVTSSNIPMSVTRAESQFCF